jgi:hypothetical protein
MGIKACAMALVSVLMLTILLEHKIGADYFKTRPQDGCFTHQIQLMHGMLVGCTGNKSSASSSDQRRLGGALSGTLPHIFIANPHSI